MINLSIIIPVYNAETYLTNCLDSLLNQNLKTEEYEILIINDGSIDKSEMIAKEYETNHDNIKLYNQENRGVGAARNLGITQSQGKYIYFIDPDDYLVKNRFKTILGYGNRNDVDILTFISKKTTFYELIDLDSDISNVFCSDSLNGLNYIAKYGFRNEVWRYIVKRDFLLINNIKFIEGKWMEDAIFTVAVMTKGTKICHLSLDCHRHFKRPGSAMTSREPNHFKKVIFDMENAIIYYELLINKLEGKVNKTVNLMSIKRLVEKQQIMVFFMLVRILKSNLKGYEKKEIINKMKDIGVYPMTSISMFESESRMIVFLSKILNIEQIYHLIHLIINPLFRLKYKST